MKEKASTPDWYSFTCSALSWAAAVRWVSRLELRSCLSTSTSTRNTPDPCHSRLRSLPKQSSLALAILHTRQDTATKCDFHAFSFHCYDASFFYFITLSPYVSLRTPQPTKDDHNFGMFSESALPSKETSPRSICLQTSQVETFYMQRIHRISQNLLVVVCTLECLPAN